MAEQIGEIKRVGGWRGSPNTIASLLRHQVRYPHQRQVPWRARIVKSGAYGRGESRYIAKLERLGLLPFDLLALPAWRRLADLPVRKRCPMRLALLNAWDKRDKAPLHWAQVQRQALDLL